jgi:hypothetical protein
MRGTTDASHVTSAATMHGPGLLNHYWNEEPMFGCQIGTKCPILHAKQDPVYPISLSDELRFRVWVQTRSLLFLWLVLRNPPILHA